MKARKYFEQNRLAAFIGFTLILVLVIGLAIIIPLGLPSGTPGTKPTPTPTTGAVTPTPTTGVVTPTPTPGTKPTPTPTPTESTPTPVPGVVLGPQACPDAVKDPAHWKPFLTVPPDTLTYNPWNVTCGYMLDKPSLQATVKAWEIIGGGPPFLSVFVFDKITDPKPQLLFKVGHLLEGDAQISGYSTLLTAEIDNGSSINKGKPFASMTMDLFREFQWSSKAGKFVQVAFPGIFPDLTRYQAEQDQIMVNLGSDTWKNDPKQVVQRLAAKFFGWNRPLKATLISGGGAKDVNATVKVDETPLNGLKFGPGATVTLNRLGGNTRNMWVAIAVQDGSALTLTNIKSASLVASPVKLEGKGDAFENTIGMAYIMDHLYTTVGQGLVMGSTGIGLGNVPYSIQVSYDTSFKQGPQEGIVEVLRSTSIESHPYSAVMVKVLLDSKPRVALGPVTCPVALQVPGYWEKVPGIDPAAGGVGTVSCGSLKGDPSLQALVPVYYTNGKPGHFDVYDRITDAHPVKLFSLQTGGAAISGYSTIMTGDIDLFREFQWSGKAGIFVQVAFPGIFPDLTRSEAEQDQNQVTMGKDTWKNDPKQVAQRLAVKFFKWAANAPATILSGGGPKDVNAVVQVKSTFPGGGAINVKLSRLEGNTANMWVVIGVEDGNGLLTITSPVKGDRLTSPVTVKGTGGAFEGVIGQAFVLDHLYTTIGNAKVNGAIGMGKTTYSTTVNYTSTFTGGTQEGIVVVYAYSQADGSIAKVVMVKVLLG